MTIGDGVTSIGRSAFEGCSGLTSIVIPESVTYIGGSAFNGCSNLTNVTIGDGVTSIGSSAFEGCSSLTSVMLPVDLISIEGGIFAGCSSLTSITIPDSVTSIGSSAFNGCSGLTSVTIGDGVTSIGENAFSDCAGLTSIVIPDGVTSIGWSAFEDCTGLASVTIGNGVTSIGGWAFSDCSGLTSIAIPDSVISIGDDAFLNCYGLTIYCQAASQPSGWSSSWNADRPVVWGYSADEVTYHFVSNGGPEIESIVSALPISLPKPEKDGYIFAGWYLSSDFSGNMVYSSYYNADGATLYAKWIDLDGFEQSAGLEIEYGYIVGIGSCTDTELLLNMPIAEGAFIGCHTITKVTFGPGVTYIGYQAFGDSRTGCNNLTEVVFLAPVPPEIGSDVFGSTWNRSGFTVYVPQGSLDAYEAVGDQYWQQYLVDGGKIREM